VNDMAIPNQAEQALQADPDDRASVDAELDLLRQRLAEMEEALEIAAIQREQWRNREAERSRQLAELRHGLSDQAELRDRVLAEARSEAEAERAALLAHVEEAREACESVRAKLAAVEAEHGQLSAQARADREATLCAVSGAEAERRRVEAIVAELVGDISRLEIELDEISLARIKAEGARKEFHARLDEAREERDRLEAEIARERESRQAEVARERQARDSVAGQLADVERERERLAGQARAEQARMVAMVRDLNAEIANCEHELDLLADARRRDEAAQADVLARLGQARTERVALKLELAASQETCAELTERLEAIERDHARLAAEAAAQNAAAQAAIEQEMSERARAELAVQQLTTEIAALEREIGRLIETQVERASQRSARLSAVSRLINGDLAERRAAAQALRGEMESGETPVPALGLNYTEPLDSLFVPVEQPADLAADEAAVTDSGAADEDGEAPVPAEPACEAEPSEDFFENNPHVRVLFDETFYLSANPDVAEANRPPFNHFRFAGRFERRDPHPLFCMATYCRHVGELPEGIDPVTHYLREGWRNGLNPCPQFDPAFYLSQLEPGEAEGMAPLVHYLEHGAARGLSPSPRFDVASYVANRPEVDFTAVTPLAHYRLWLRDPANYAPSGPLWSIDEYEKIRPLLETMARLHAGRI